MLATAKNYKFKLVEFIDEGDDIIKSIDIVPTEWITYDDETHDLFTKFIPDCSKQNVVELRNRVEAGKSPLKSWPRFRIAVKGYADTYSHAEKKLLKLKNAIHTTYAFTTDNDEVENARKEFQQKEIYKLKGKKKVKGTCDTLQMPAIVDLEKPIRSSDYTNIEPSCDVPIANNKTEMENIIIKKHRSGQNKHISNESSESNSNNEFNDLESSSDTINTSIRTDKISKNQKLKRKTNIKHCSANNKWSNVAHQFDHGSIHSENDISYKKRRTDDIEKENCNRLIINDKTMVKGITNGNSHHEKNNDNINTRYKENRETITNFEKNLINVDEANELSLQELILKCYRNLSAQIARLAGHITEIKIKQDEIVASHPIEIHKASNFKKLYDFLKKEEIESIPFKTLESFEIFDAELKIDEAFREDLKNFMWSSIDASQPVMKAITKILKKFMSRDVVISYTAKKSKGCKKAIKDTTFGECMKDAIVTEYRTRDNLSSVKDDKFFQALGSVINNAKDWDGKRNES